MHRELNPKKDNNFNFLEVFEGQKNHLDRLRVETLIIQRCKSEYAEDLWLKMELERPLQVKKIS